VTDVTSGGTFSTPAYVQVYLIDSQPLTLIDTGPRTLASRARLEAALEELGHAFVDIERVVVTHAHRDHMGLVQSIRDAGADLECLVHEADAPVVEAFPEVVRRRVTELMPLFREYGVPEEFVLRMHEELIDALVVDEAEGEATTVDRVLREGDRIEWKEFAFDVHHSPGHTAGHILLEDEGLSLLLTGDQVMGQAIPYAENYYQDELPDPSDPLRRRPRFRGLVQLRQSLRRLRGRPYKIFLPSYGGVIHRTDRAIRDTLLHYDVRLQRIDRGLRHLAAMGQDVTAFEIWKALFPADEPLGDMCTHMLLLIGALDCLEDDGKLVTERRPDGVLTHHHH
jgi:glyoxylase-like metal-dependent hydrolase (beta-lactamase superfamily II)